MHCKEQSVSCSPSKINKKKSFPSSHCPWVWSCGQFRFCFWIAQTGWLIEITVGMNNHRQFLLFVTTLVIGVCLFDYLTYACQLFRFQHWTKGINMFQSDSISNIPSIPPSDISPSCSLPTDHCAITTYDCFLVSVASWATLQLLWTVILLASQLWQVARQMSSLEVSNLGRYGFMGGRGGAHTSICLHVISFILILSLFLVAI